MKKICVLLMCLLLLSGCGAVAKEDWEHGESACKTHGGVKFYIRSSLFSDSVICDNGARISRLQNFKVEK